MDYMAVACIQTEVCACLDIKSICLNASHQTFEGRKSTPNMGSRWISFLCGIYPIWPKPSRKLAPLKLLCIPHSATSMVAEWTWLAYIILEMVISVAVPASQVHCDCADSVFSKFLSEKDSTSKLSWVPTRGRTRPTKSIAAAAHHNYKVTKQDLNHWRLDNWFDAVWLYLYDMFMFLCQSTHLFNIYLISLKT